MPKKNKTLIICGCGFISTMASAAIIDLWEREQGRFSLALPTPRRQLLETLSAYADNETLSHIYFNGIGLNLLRVGLGATEQERLLDLLHRLVSRGIRMVWLANWDTKADGTQDSLGGLLQIIGTPHGKLPLAAWNAFHPQAMDDAAFQYMLQTLESPPTAAWYQVVGFITRVMQNHPGYGQEMAGLFIRHLQNPNAKILDTPRARMAGSLYHRFGHRELRGKTEAMACMQREIRRVAAHDDVRVLILGETGTGKESVATHLHLNSPRWEHPFLSFNCASSNPGLLEAAFRGFRKGTFTGAHQDRAGLFERAHQGTLFLDEIGDLPLEAQGTLLRILEEKRVTPLGDYREQEVDVRLVTATNKNLGRMAQDGAFRRDLLYRLQEYTIKTPPLRQIREDIPRIADSIWRGMQHMPLPAQAASVLVQYDWPGNSRELMNFLKYVRVTGGNDWNALLRQYQAMNRWDTEEKPQQPLPALRPLEEATALYCRQALQACHGNISQAAARLGIQRATLRRHLDKLKDLCGE